MSSTPLLSQNGLPAPVIMQDHPVFLRCSHSPWRWIPQNALVGLRGCVLAYLVATSVMTGHYKMNVEESEDSPLANMFDFSLISYAMTFMYHLITFAWTFTHLYYPEPNEVEGRAERWIIKTMSLPRNMASQRKQFHFNLFYIATTVFCFMNSTIYWFVTRQHDAGDAANVASKVAANVIGASVNMSSAATLPDTPFSDLFGEGWFTGFMKINMHAINSCIMTIECLFFNSIKKPHAIGSSILCTAALSGLYLVWGGIGKSVSGKFPFFWMDEEQVGSKEAVSLYCTGFVGLSVMMFALMHGFVGIRESLTRRSESRGANESLDS
ncbi:hypothetical protein X797_010896 [Metarhizium robertsii]|uniref:FAR-17a/AIG1-like protein n=2 Tax=Metarhizium robertsii TaxID=568076 RepID=E9F8W1_METRA|nr:uncharacterized protein MAA_08710 [Metarhizium robertsii ARSEF 23]EFY95902.1 hypothetical protein MAA_08710 [Metarhizium robertsii ARSEF 23]EXU96002.1 hypothetical protein X797_010896 [Metarhizium robertsii]